MNKRTAATLDKLTQCEARQLLLDLGALATLRAWDRDHAQRYVAELLAQGNTRAQTRDRLVVRYGISPRSAYRLIDTAIQNRAKTGEPWHTGGPK